MITYIIPTHELSRTYLDEQKLVWIECQVTDAFSVEDYNRVWACKPEEPHVIKMYGKEVVCPRFTRIYKHAYKFSGMTHEVIDDPPDEIERLLLNAQQINPSLNQILVNWYLPTGCIGNHSDDTRQLVPDSEIWSYSFGPAQRTFVLTPKKGDHIYNVKLVHNTLVKMGGKCQQYYYHAVLREKNSNLCRLNVTFRCFATKPEKNSG